MHSGAPLGLKDGRTPLAAPCMDPGTITLSEMSQTETDRASHEYNSRVELKMIQMNVFTKQKQTHRRGKYG